MKLIKILGIGVSYDASGWYRVRQYFNEFDRQNLAQVHIISGGEEQKELDSLIKAADIIVSQYNVNIDLIRYALTLNPNVKFVLDFDDNCLKVPPSSPAYKEWGTEDVVVKGIELWVSGKTQGFNKFKNRKLVAEVKELAGLADVVTCASPKLVDFMGKYAKNTAFVANTIDPKLISKNKVEKDSGTFDILWQGTSIHQMELSSILDPLEGFLRTNKDAHYYQLGHKPDKKLSKKFKKRVHSIPWVQFQAVVPTLTMRAPDVSIIPLRENAFNYYKAESKWLDLSAAGIPTIVQAPSPYADYIDHGSNGILFSDGDNMVKQLQWAYDNRDKLKEIGDRARVHVLKNRNLETWARQLINFYKGL